MTLTDANGWFQALLMAAGYGFVCGWILGGVVGWIRSLVR